MSEYLLEMKNISKEFPGVKALDNVDFKIKKSTIHSLMGENGAGKSTLMKCLFGIYSKDSGTIHLDGEIVDFQNPRQALDNRVAMVHQELNQVLTRNVMENIWLGRFPKNAFGLVNHRAMYEKTKEIFDKIDIDIDPKAKISTLSVSQRQMVDIAKAVSFNAKVIVFDEPTSSLTEVEVKKLFWIINKLKANGCGIIYISHKMVEILKISDEVTVMRDGRFVSTNPANKLTTEMIIKDMVGREIKNVYPEKTNVPGGINFEVKDLSCRYLNLHNVSFTARRGEILGFSGLNGSGKTELMQSIFGLTTLESGSIYIDGKEINNTSSQESIKNGFALLVEERRTEGIFGVLSVRDNITISKGRKYLRRGFIDSRQIDKDSKDVIKNLNVKTPGPNVKIQSLSGGNQQKVIIGRWLLTDPQFLLLDEPTRGIDVGAKYEIYQIILRLANEGKNVFVVSSEMTELLGICDRIIVMSNGRVAGEVYPDSTSQEEIMTLSAKYV